MSPELISILVLAALFFVATVLPVHMGALALVAAFIVGTTVAGENIDGVDGVLAGFPADLFIILVGVTYLFALAKDNGTIDWLVDKAVSSVGGRVALIPWVMFVVTGCLTAIGSVVPAAVAIIAPMGMGFAQRYGIRPLLMGLMVINGATAGGFSPLSIFGGITNGVVERAGLPGSPTLLFLASVVANVILGLITFVLFGGRDLIGKRDVGGELIDGGAGGGTGPTAPAGQARDRTARASTTSVQTTQVPSGASGANPQALDRARIITLVGLVALIIGVLFFQLNVGFTAITIAVIVSLASPGINKGAISAIAWPTVLLICGIVTYVSVMEAIGTIEWLGNGIASIGAPLLAAILICYIGAVVSAFASTTGILASIIPLAVPFLMAGEIGPIGLVIALAISSSVVDSSPFSTSGALVVANAPEDERDAVFRQLMIWGFSMVAIAPPVVWLVLVVPGWG